jgi:hypothetical protein
MSSCCSHQETEQEEIAACLDAMLKSMLGAALQVEDKVCFLIFKLFLFFFRHFFLARKLCFHEIVSPKFITRLVISCGLALSLSIM